MRSISILRTWKILRSIPLHFLFIIILIFFPNKSSGRIFIDINSPSITKIVVAIPEFKNFSKTKEHPELTNAFSDVINNDLDLSGYFIPMEKEAFLDQDGPLLTSDNIRFRNWTVGGAELLLKGGYSCIGNRVEVEARLYDTLRGTQIFGRKFLGKIDESRTLSHRIGNEIILRITGYNGMFLSKFAFVNRIVGNNENIVKEIFVCDFDGHNARQITYENGFALLPRWSPSGDSILYNSIREGGTMLFMRNLKEEKTYSISKRKGLNTGACWTPDHKDLALTLSFNDNQDIYLIDLQGRIKERYTKNSAIDISPTFSPDGTKFAFVSDRSGPPQIWVKDLKTGKEDRITWPDRDSGGFESRYSCSPDWSVRNQIAFSSNSDSGRDIYIMNPDGSSVKRLTENSDYNEDPCWSPDGRYIVFSSDRQKHGEFHLYIMNANGLNQRRISFIKGEQTAPSWSMF